jgi:hypothetical protein
MQIPISGIHMNPVVPTPLTCQYVLKPKGPSLHDSLMNGNSLILFLLNVILWACDQPEDAQRLHLWGKNLPAFELQLFLRTRAQKHIMARNTGNCSQAIYSGRSHRPSARQVLSVQESKSYERLFTERRCCDGAQRPQWRLGSSQRTGLTRHASHFVLLTIRLLVRAA